MHGTIILVILYALILPGCVLLQPTEPFSPVPVTEATDITAPAPAPSQPTSAKEEVVPEALTLERQMAMVDNLDNLEFSSIEGMYTLLANFKYGVNVDVAYQDALAAMARVARQLPKVISPV